jgi:hypothetical protein
LCDRDQPLLQVLGLHQHALDDLYCAGGYVAQGEFEHLTRQIREAS